MEVWGPEVKEAVGGVMMSDVRREEKPACDIAIGPFLVLIWPILIGRLSISNLAELRCRDGCRTEEVDN